MPQKALYVIILILLAIIIALLYNGNNVLAPGDGDMQSEETVGSEITFYVTAHQDTDPADYKIKLNESETDRKCSGDESGTCDL